MSAEALAHSAHPAQGIGPQTYREHIDNVADGAQARVEAMLRHYSPVKGSPSSESLQNIVACAAEFHDLGKLDPGFQKTLRENRTSDAHIRHEDAGSAWLIRESQRLANPALLEAAALVASHHQGLVHYRVDDTDYFASGGEAIKLDVEGFRIQDEKTRKATELRLESYVSEHRDQIDASPFPNSTTEGEISGLTRRLLLSCLVDADHSDTARHYQNEKDFEAPATRWEERLDALRSYVQGLKKSPISPRTEAVVARQEIRDDLFRLCWEADTSRRIYSCDAVVGSGKTTAVMAHLLQTAILRGLRHIIIVLPYTNIITQSVDVYRRALCLEGEDPERIVAEHHHQVEFRNLDVRHLTTTWKAPIIVTTAVQFFETLGGNGTVRLRKLHELAGSAVFLDEAHAALPATLWPGCWNWLLECTRCWNGHLVLASGSLPEFWKMETFRSICEGSDPGRTPTTPAPDIPALSPGLKRRSEAEELVRVKFDTIRQALSVDELTDRIVATGGPRIVVVNTVQAAAFLASHLRESNKTKVLHLSTSLSPTHRAIIINRVKNLLKHQKDWVLVATSLVEAGMDFSFQNGFRQRSSAASLIQLGGRVNRSSNLEGDSFVWDFTFADTRTFPDNPVLKPSQEVLLSMFSGADPQISPDKPCNLSAICLAAMTAEFRPGKQIAASEIVRAENDCDYPKVASLCRVIQTETRTVVVDQLIADRIRNRKPVTRLEVARNSVQMYHTKIKKLEISPIRPDLEDIYELPSGWSYDPDFLGYMDNEVRLRSAEIESGYFV